MNSNSQNRKKITPAKEIEAAYVGREFNELVNGKTVVCKIVSYDERGCGWFMVLREDGSTYKTSFDFIDTFLRLLKF